MVGTLTNLNTVFSRGWYCDALWRKALTGDDDVWETCKRCMEVRVKSVKAAFFRGTISLVSTYTIYTRSC
jgi:hypothetical protein